MSSHKSFFKRLYETYQSYVWEDMRDVKFALAGLEEPGIVGAAMQAMIKLEK